MCLAVVYVHFSAGQVVGGENKGHFTPRTVPAAAPSAIPARKATPSAAKPRQDSRDIFQ